MANHQAATTVYNNDIYSEKMIAQHEGWFKESALSKPQNVYLTITAAHIYGQAYIMEQQGTLEGDPVYSRFVCNIEDITKVYVNDNVKANSLFIQCDTDVKGVVHRKRIIVPCLENVDAVVAEILEVHAAHMKKLETKQQKKLERRKEEIKAEKEKEEIRASAKKQIPPLPNVNKFDFDPTIPASVVEKAAEKAESIESAAAEPAPAETAAQPPVNDKKGRSLKTDLDDDLKAIEELSKLSNNDEIESIKAKRTRLAHAKQAGPDQVEELVTAKIKPPKKVTYSGEDELETIESTAEVPETVERNAADELEGISAPSRKKPPKVTYDTPDELETLEIPTDVIPDPVDSAKDMVASIEDSITEIDLGDDIPADNTAHEEQAAVQTAPEPVVPKAPEVSEPVKETVTETAAAPEKAQTEKVQVSHTSAPASLSDYESAVIALKKRMESGEITPEQYSAERKNLIRSLM